MSSQLQVSGEAKIRAIQGPVVANSGVITALDGDASQYVRGDGTLADFPTSTGGGSSVSYYLNSSVSQGTIGGVAYRQLSKTPISGAGTDIAISTTGYVASYLTDANDPALLEVPAGNFNCEFYFSVNNNTGNPFVYAEVYKYDGTTFTSIGTSVGVPEYINQGTVINPYYFAVPVAVAALTVTDRIAIRIYVNVDGRTVTLHTENNHLCQVVTTFSKGLISLNNLTRQNQFFATGTSGTDFAIVSSVATHTFNLPVASATNTGKLSSTDWSTFNGKVPYTGATTNVDLGVNYLKARTFYAEGNGGGGSYAIKNGATPSFEDGYTILSSNDYRLNILSTVSTVTKAVYLGFSGVTATRTFTLPDITGTLALLEGSQTFSGAKTFANNIKIDNGVDGNYIGFKQYGSGSTATTGFTTLYSISTNGFGIGFGTTKAIQFDSASVTTFRTYTFPDSDGTIALLSGTQTFTGATTFSSDLLVSGLTIGRGSSAVVGNTAIGLNSLFTNTTGVNNSALGYNSLRLNTTGGNNTAIGVNALQNNTTTSSNTAIGYNSLNANTGGSNNTAIGVESLISNTTGSNNIAIGNTSGNAITTGSNNTIIGAYAGTTTLANNIVLADGAGTIRYQWDGTNNVFGNPISGTSATFSSSVTATSESSLFKEGFIVKATTTGGGGSQPAYTYYTAAGSKRWSHFLNVGDDKFNIANAANSEVFTLAQTGAATFSSSVGVGGATNTLGFLEVWKSGSAIAQFSIGQNATYHTDFFVDTTGNFYVQPQGTTRLTLASTGAATFSSSITLVNDLTINAALTPIIFLNTTSTNKASGFVTQESGTNKWGIGSNFGTADGTFNLYNYGAAARYITITSGGNVWIGGTGYSAIRLSTRGENTSSTHWAFMADDVNGANLFGIRNDQQVYAAGISTGTGTALVLTSGGYIVKSSSSIRYKKDVQPIDIGLDFILSLNPVSYNLKDGNVPQVGFIAEEFPEDRLVSTSMIDPMDESKGYQKEGVNYAQIVAPLVKAIQELEARIKQLENK